MNCPVCGKFMRRLKTIERIRLEVETGRKMTHICKRASISYQDGLYEHE